MKESLEDSDAVTPIIREGQNLKLRDIEIDQLVVSEANLRSDEPEPERLIEQLRAEGKILEPLHVWFNQETSFYEIMDGQHRFLAAKHLGWDTVPCIVHWDITTLREAYVWCRKQYGQRKDLTLKQKKDFANDLIKDYGSLKAGCDAEGYEYGKIYEWSRIPDEVLDSPISDLRVLRELSRLDRDDIAKLVPEIEGLDRDSALYIIKKHQRAKESLDSPKSLQIEAKPIMDMISDLGDPDEYGKQQLWCHENWFEIMGPVYEAYRPEEKNQSIIRTTLQYLEDRHPETVRSILYYLTSLKVIDKDFNLSQVLSRARKAGLLPYDWIIDLSREPILVYMWDSIEDFIVEALNQYRSNWWEEQEYYVEVWIEKRTLIKKLTPICRHFGVTLMPCGGWTSITWLEEGANRYREWFRKNKKLVMIYLGDFDPSGRKMYEKLREEFALRYIPIYILSFVLDLDQIEIFNLEWAKKPVNRQDNNTPGFIKKYCVDWTVEVDAIDTETLGAGLVTLLSHFINEDALKFNKERDKKIIEGYFKMLKLKE